MNRNRKTHQACFEALESRQLMAFGPIVNPNPTLAFESTGPYTINGTSGHDFIRVSSINSPATGRRLTIEVNANPAVIVSINSSREVNINGLAGNDRIEYSGSDGVRVFGGAGNDTITTGTGRDTLLGEAGFDSLDGGRGSDVLSGGTEADTATYASRTAGLFVTANNIANDGEAGENDSVQLDVETIIGGSGNDNLSFATAAATARQLWGNGGNDTLVGSPGADTMLGGAGNDSMNGNEGGDFLVGEAGNDTLNGDGGGDLLSGGANNDLLLGGNGMDTLWGDDGDDTLEGGLSDDQLNGGTNEDILRGQGGADLLRGDGGDDRLYGGADADVLQGGAGFDGLFGGVDTVADQLTGGSENDRFLFMSGDVITDRIAVEARVVFENGKEETVNFGGQDGTHTYAAGTWTDFSVEAVDTALHALHKVSRNTRLLKRFDRGELKFIRQGDLIEGTFSAAAWNSGGGIHVVETTIGTIFHEIGHNFDDEFDGAGWRSLSGWTQTDKSNDPLYQAGEGNDGWFHLKSAEFVSSYARTNPREDFAEHFETFMKMRVFGPLPMPVAKFEFINSMVNTLALQP